MKVYFASVQTETNTFSPLRAGARDFEALAHAPGAHPEKAELYTAALICARRAAANGECMLIEGPCWGAQPAGLIRADVWERMRDAILEDIQARGPFDIILLGLHGAMVAVGEDDCEGDLLSRIRAQCGPDVTIAANLDPHCHLSAAMRDNADLLIAFKEYPHTDSMERGQELWALALATAKGEVRPVMSVVDCAMMTMFFTPMEPTALLVAAFKAAEKEQPILSASLIHGFPWGDVPDFGVKVLVITDNAPERGAQVAAELAERVVALRGKSMERLTPLHKVAARALEPGEDPWVIADFADNPGAGCPGDSTFLIRALMDAGVEDAAAAFIFDPVAVSLAHAAGVGARLSLRVGGKTCSFSGPPLDLEVDVMHLAHNAVHNVFVVAPPLGDVAVVRAKGRFDLVITEQRSQCFAPWGYTDFGIDLSTKKVLIVKSMQHFRAGFSNTSRRFLYADSPGAASMNLADLPYRKINRDYWPFSAAG